MYARRDMLLDLGLFTEFEEWVQWKSGFGLDWMVAERGNNFVI